MALLAAGLLSGPANAKDIKLGGGQKGDMLNVHLPPMKIMIPTGDGGWKHIQIDAWLMAKDQVTARAMDVAKNNIVNMADKEMPNRDWQVLANPELGSNEVKKVIHAAAEAGLGHPWQGDVMLQSFLIY
jgi:hypothetical protein